MNSVRILFNEVAAVTVGTVGAVVGAKLGGAAATSFLLATIPTATPFFFPLAVGLLAGYYGARIGYQGTKALLEEGRAAVAPQNTVVQRSHSLR
jgi:hypothetical protein